MTPKEQAQARKPSRKWLVHNYGEQGSGWQVEVEAETREEAIQKAPYDWQDPNRTYYGAVEKT